jgi:TatD DNase family protein
MKLFDSHCHLDDAAFGDTPDEIIRRAAQQGVVRITTIGVDLETSRRAVQIAESHEGVYATVGIHPHDAKTGSEDALAELVRLADHPKVRAWGEIGLDFNRMYSPRQVQEKWFVRQLELASALRLPVVFHERESQGRLLEVLGTDFSKDARGVIHCFSGTESELEAYLDLGLFIGVTGIITQKDRGALLRRMVPRIPAEHLLLETDAPYLVPAPERTRTRRNEPAFLRSVLLQLASVRAEDPESLARATFQNACRLYGIRTGSILPNAGQNLAGGESFST